MNKDNNGNVSCEPCDSCDSFDSDLIHGFDEHIGALSFQQNFCHCQKKENAKVS